MSTNLRFVGPNGSLRNRWRGHLATVGYNLSEPDDRGYCGTINGIEFYERDRRMVPLQVERLFDAGLTGRDLVAESGVQDLRVMGELCFSRSSNNPTRWVMAADFLFDEEQTSRLADGTLRIGCELPRLGKMLFSASPYKNREHRIVKLEGNEEASIDDGLCDAVICVTETGGAIKRAKLRILAGCEELFLSVPQIIAKRELSAEKEERLSELVLSLQAAMNAAGQVMVTFDLPETNLEALCLPAEVAPTIAPLTMKGWISVQICTARSGIPSMLRKIHAGGGKAVAMQNIDAFLK